MSVFGFLPKNISPKRAARCSSSNLRKDSEKVLSKEFQDRDASPCVIIRLADVLQRTGLSRSTIYNRIARSEFPRQVSLGARAIGWIEQEVERWIAERVHLRQSSQAESVPDIALDVTCSIKKEADCRHSEKNQPRNSIRIKPSGNIVLAHNELPDLEQLQLVATRLYIDRNTGAFWLQLFSDKTI